MKKLYINLILNLLVFINVVNFVYANKLNNCIYQSNIIQQKIDTIRVLDTCNNRSFNEFWVKFRKAIINKDYTFLESHTIFPINTRGPWEGDPFVKFQKKSFEEVFNFFIEQGAGMGKGRTVFEYVKDTPSMITEYIERAPSVLSKEEIISRTCIKEKAYVSLMNFKLKDNKWYLNFLNLDHLTYKKLQIKEYKEYY